MSKISETYFDIKIKKKLYDGGVEDIDLCFTDGDKWRIPFLHEGFQNQNWKRDEIEFHGTLRDYQKMDHDKAINLLKTKKSVFLSLYCGYGKTIMGLSLASKLNYKTLILVDQTLIKMSWINTIAETSNSEVREMSSIIPESPIVIANILSLRKFSYEELECFGTVIVDEALYFTTPLRLSLIMKTSPKYLIGMCADIKREDGLHEALYHLYTTPKDMIKSKSSSSIKLYIMLTKFKPIEKYIRIAREQRIDWNTMLDSISSNKERTLQICQMLKLFASKKCLVISKRKEQCKEIYDYLESKCLSVDILVGKSKSYNNCNILVSSYSKMFKGFDGKRCCNNFDGKPFQYLFILSDIKNPEQLVGRVLRSDNPNVVYFLDDHSMFKNHFQSVEQYFKTKISTEFHREWLR